MQRGFNVVVSFFFSLLNIKKDYKPGLGLGKFSSSLDSVVAGFAVVSFQMMSC